MNTICSVPLLDSTLNQLVYTTAAAIAYPYDEIILSYPKMHDYPKTQISSNIDTVRRTNAVLQILARPVWIKLNALWPAHNRLKPALAYRMSLQDSIMEARMFWSMLPVTAHKWVKGFTYDHCDYARMFGNTVLATTNSQTFFDRDYTNALIGVARSYSLPAMIITSRAGDITGNIYRYSDTNDSGAAKWPSILGKDSSFEDWLIARDLFYAPTWQNINEADYPVGPGKNFMFLGQNSTFWSFFESLPVLQQCRSSNLSVGILQHLDFSANVGDGALDPVLTMAQKIFLNGMATFLQLVDLQGYGVAALAPSGFMPSLSSITNASVLPARNGPATFYSVNGEIIADYMNDKIPTRIVTTQSFDAFYTFQQTA